MLLLDTDVIFEVIFINAVRIHRMSVVKYFRMYDNRIFVKTTTYVLVPGLC
jgi:hypothetical protein